MCVKMVLGCQCSLKLNYSQENKVPFSPTLAKGNGPTCYMATVLTIGQ